MLLQASYSLLLANIYNPVLDLNENLVCDHSKTFLNILPSFCAGFNKKQIASRSKLPSQELINLSIEIIIHFITNQNHLKTIGRAEVPSIAKPSGNLLEALLLGNIEDNKGANGALVISLGYRPEILLSCSVPYLKSYTYSWAGLDHLWSELHSNSWVGVLSELLLHKALEKTAFSHRRISNQNQLEKVLIRVHFIVNFNETKKAFFARFSQGNFEGAKVLSFRRILHAIGLLGGLFLWSNVMQRKSLIFRYKPHGPDWGFWLKKSRVY